MNGDFIADLAIMAIFSVMLGTKLFLSPGNLGRKLVIFFLFVLGMYISMRVYPSNRPEQPNTYTDRHFVGIVFALIYAVYESFFDYD